MALPPSAPPPAPQAGPPAAGAPAQAPFGGSPAVTPSRNPGFEAAGKQKVAMALKVLTDALPLYGASSDEGQELLDIMKKLGKIAQPGDVSNAGQMNALQKMMLNAAQQQRTQKALAQSPQAGGGAPPGAGAAPGAAPPMAA
jgi:hypothetical protein